jgi:type IV pilus assembly protein PilY1
MKSTQCPVALRPLLAALALGLTSAGQAAQTDISQVPLIVSFGTPVKPNLMFIFDDSGSMGEFYLPEGAALGVKQYSLRAPQCNGLAYSPLTNYTLPLNYDGTTKPNAPIANAFKANDDLDSVRDVTEDGRLLINSGELTYTIEGNNPATSWYAVGDMITIYDNSTPTSWMLGQVKSWSATTRKLVVTMAHKSTTGLTAGATTKLGRLWPLAATFAYSGAQPKLSWTYAANGAVKLSAPVPVFNAECNSTVGSLPGSAVFTTRIVTPTDPDAQNFANWYAYYANRLRMMKTVTAQAFYGLDDSFRVGFSRISTKQAKEVGTAWLHARDFTSGATGQRKKFYDAVNATNAGSTTPLRGALSLAGLYYAKKASGQDLDPVEHACQKNFSILATDGAWNPDMETATFGPYKVNGDAVGNQDGAAEKPLKDALNISNTLADVAMYFYETDLRSSTLGNCTGAGGNDVCENDVPAIGKDTAKHQHMTTFTLSLGQNGTLKYCQNYEDGNCADFNDLISGQKVWPNPSGATTRVDDLWHAAVNGRGTFFNAADASGVADSLKQALAKIEEVVGRGAAGATSTIQPVEGDNSFFVGGFTSGSWHGDLVAYEIDPVSYAPKVKNGDGSDAAKWSAANMLPAAGDRKIYYANGGALAKFDENTQAGAYKDKCQSLSQYPTLTAATKLACDDGKNMVNFLRGKNQDYYRSRATGQLLGDIVGSAPVYDGNRGAQFTDAGYSDYVATTRKNRGKVVYVGANDGMMHAFNADTGVELWAFIPTAVKDRLHKLADKNYGSNHEFFVDGPALTADVQIGGQWRTILVGGLGAGGRSYYALDVTEPTAPKLLWEFSDANLGNTHAKPVITKRKDGTWVVAVPSGFNGASGGDGKGRLFLIKAADGTSQSWATTEGSAATPSGLGPITAWVDDRADNTALRFYAGDNEGNVWRFDPDGNLGAGNSVVKLAELIKDGKRQPVTTPPRVSFIKVAGFESAVVFVGTGRMVGKSDLSNTDVQSIYAIRDPLDASSWGDIRAGGKLVEQKITTTVKDVVGDDGKTSTVRSKSMAAEAVNWSDKAGWFVDLTDSGERINAPMVLSGSTLVAASNVPKSTSTCEAGNQGFAWIYYLDIASGNAEFDLIETSMVAGINAVGKGVLIVPASNEPPTYRQTKQPATKTTTSRRANWREVIDR